MPRSWPRSVPGLPQNNVTETIWKAPAISDLMAIADYIAEDNPAAAMALVEEIEAKVAHLTEHPGQGRPGRVAGTRELVIRPNFLVVYATGGGDVTVLRVLHAAQMWP